MPEAKTSQRLMTKGKRAVMAAAPDGDMGVGLPDAILATVGWLVDRIEMLEVEVLTQKQRRANGNAMRRLVYTGRGGKQYWVNREGCEGTTSE